MLTLTSVGTNLDFLEFFGVAITSVELEDCVESCSSMIFTLFSVTLILLASFISILFIFCNSLSTVCVPGSESFLRFFLAPLLGSEWLSHFLEEPAVDRG